MVTAARGSTWNTVTNLGFINVKDTPYGAVGDGTTNDTAAFVAALATGYPVYVPPGTYSVTTLSVASLATLFGCGPLSIIKLRNSTNAALLSLSGAAGVVLDNLSVDGNKANQTGAGVHGISILSASSGVDIREVYIYNTLGNGINVKGVSTDITITNGGINGFVGSGIVVEDALRVAINNPNIYSSDAAAYPGDGIALAPAAVGDLVTGVRITGGCIRSVVGRGVAAVGSGGQNVTNSSVTGTYIKSNTSHGVHILTAKQLTVSGVISTLNGGDGFRLEGNTIQSNIIGGIADTNTGYGAREVTSGSTPDYNGFIGCKAVSNVASNVITKLGTNSTIVT